MAKNGVIGNNNSLPWRLPVDLRYFRRTTTGHTIVMGRRNYEDIGRALPERRNIILSRTDDFTAADCEIAHSIGEVMRLIDLEEETFIIGGAEIYKSFLPLADKLYITHVDADIEGDVVFPAYNPGDWKMESENIIPADNENTLPCRFCVYNRQD